MGFPRFSSAILAKARAEWGHPNAVGTLSTWHFQMSTSSPPADEYGGLDRWLRTGHNPRHHGGDHSRDPNPGGDPTVEWKHTMSAVPGGFERHRGRAPCARLSRVLHVRSLSMGRVFLTWALIFGHFSRVSQPP